MVRTTNEEFLNKLNSIGSRVIPLEPYVNSDTKILVRCTMCGNEWRAYPYNLYAGKECSICKHKENGKKQTKSTEDFIKEMKIINPNIKILEEYQGSHQKIKCECMIHSVEFATPPTHLLRGKTGCKLCIKNKLKSHRISHEQYIQDVNKVNPNISILGKYTGVSETIEVQCKTCGFIWSPSASSLKCGYGCPKCVGRHKTTEEFKQEISQINPDIEIIGEYVNSYTMISCRCKICNETWSAKPTNLRYTGCPHCKKSRGERLIMNYLKSHSINCQTQKTYSDLVGIKGKCLSYDFYLPDYDVLIEFQGEQHEHPIEHFGGEEQFEIQQYHDELKRKYASNHNITLMEIWYYDINNVSTILDNQLVLNPVEITT